MWPSNGFSLPCKEPASYWPLSQPKLTPWDLDWQLKIRWSKPAEACSSHDLRHSKSYWGLDRQLQCMHRDDDASCMSIVYWCQLDRLWCVQPSNSMTIYGCLLRLLRFEDLLTAGASAASCCDAACIEISLHQCRAHEPQQQQWADSQSLFAVVFKTTPDLGVYLWRSMYQILKLIALPGVSVNLWMFDQLNSSPLSVYHIFQTTQLSL